MQIGIFVSETWGDASGVAEVRQRARRAEALGFGAGWVPYLPWSLDALAAVQAAGEATERIELGTAVVPTYLFHPLALARQAATVEAAVGRPIALGIGCSNETVIAMHGLAYERPARHVREYLEVLVRARGGGPQVAYEGELFRVQSLFGVPGAKPAGPVFVAALGPRMLEVAGELSDGTLATWCDPGAVERVIAPGIRAAARAAGRPEPRVGAVVPVTLTQRAEAVRDEARRRFAVYETLPRYKRMLELGDAPGPADLSLIGDEAELRAGLRRFAEAGLTDFLAAPLSVGEDDWERTAAFLAEARREFASRRPSRDPASGGTA